MATSRSEIQAAPMPADTPTVREAAPGPGPIDLSVIIPVYNEQDSVGPLHAELSDVLGGLGLRYEILFIDDGSTDGTGKKLAEIELADPSVRIVSLRRNSGQTAAISAGIDLARGDVLIPMDGDGQSDPADIPRLLEKLGAGHDVVSGWRRNRRDPWLRRTLPSRLANWAISRLSGVRLHDYGCTLKAYRREVLAGVRLYGEMHRFVPIYAAWQGGQVTEIEVSHRPRTSGRSKYGLGRTLRVVLDLVLIKFLDRYGQRPIHLFGGFGLASIAASVFVFLVTLWFKFADVLGYAQHQKDFVETPLPLVVVLLFLTGVSSILMGLLAEMVMRTYYESQDKRTYLIRGDTSKDSRSGVGRTP